MNKKQLFNLINNDVQKQIRDGSKWHTEMQSEMMDNKQKDNSMNKQDKTEIIEEFLNDIIGDIEDIDGGCADCIGYFCDGVNEKIEKYGLMLDVSDGYPVKVRVATL
jgi:hypothetical protein